ncbi:RidA family protein [Diaphorobacter ruginosibacter]|jgi:enamine deaminase RidA (YjgF/YER057c/UK114 family)|uniref:RidA family protein n=1 Tax=Diaphorobacter ruginosibacter TaxID=1715720 RepID=A0A7G9RT71_9BURK|nr:RidA family protein [Diaphorobacter ruginosibacter]MDR2332485.1 RidA family protein [Burkholderiaceae bacterium]QNN58796.1 RidA family protein [Diaphorobacter ruginosibacter]
MKALYRTAALALATSFAALGAQAAEYLAHSERTQGRTYSPAVITEGGKTIWMAGVTTTTDLDGKDIRGDMEAQVRTVFALIDQTLKRAGGGMGDIVNMTVYLTDVRNGAVFQKVRSEMFAKGRYPASAQVTVSALAMPGMLVEIQATAVVGDKLVPAH